jgi:hypothetical protein
MGFKDLIKNKMIKDIQLFKYRSGELFLVKIIFTTLSSLTVYISTITSSWVYSESIANAFMTPELTMWKQLS